MVLKRQAALSVAAFGLFAYSSAAAFAATDAEITAALESLIESGDSKATVELGTPTNTGGALVYRDVVITVTGDDAGTTNVGTITVTGGDVNAAGGLIAESIRAETIRNVSGDTTATVGSMEAVNLDVTPPKDGAEPSGRVDSVSIEAIEVNEAGAPPVKVASVSFEAADYQNGYPHTVSLGVEGIEVDPAMAPEDDGTAAQLKALGYEKLLLGIQGSGSWDEATGDLTLEEFTIEGADMGSLTITGDLGGFTADVVAQLDQPSPPPELMSEITISSATVTFQDDSLTGRVLDMQAQQMGTDRATFVEQITAALPLMLTMIQNPAFQEKVANAAGTFLKDPQNISISVEPESPVTLLSIIGAAQMAPESLPDMLNAELTANVAP